MDSSERAGARQTKKLDEVMQNKKMSQGVERNEGGRRGKKHSRYVQPRLTQECVQLCGCYTIKPLAAARLPKFRIPFAGQFFLCFWVLIVETPDFCAVIRAHASSRKTAKISGKILIFFNRRINAVIRRFFKNQCFFAVLRRFLCAAHARQTANKPGVSKICTRKLRKNGVRGRIGHGILEETNRSCYCKKNRRCKSDSNLLRSLHHTLRSGSPL